MARRRKSRRTRKTRKVGVRMDHALVGSVLGPTPCARAASRAQVRQVITGKAPIHPDCPCMKATKPLRRGR